MVLKIIILLVVIAVIYFRFFAPKKEPTIKKNQKEEKQNNELDDLVPCEKCNTYVSLDDSIIKNGHYFCSNSCADLK